MRSPRQHKLDLAVADYLTACGDYLCPDATLRQSVIGAVKPPASTPEVTDSVTHLVTSGRILLSNTETGRKWSLTEQGRAWYAEHNPAS